MTTMASISNGRDWRTDRKTWRRTSPASSEARMGRRRSVSRVKKNGPPGTMARRYCMGNVGLRCANPTYLNLVIFRHHMCAVSAKWLCKKFLAHYCRTTSLAFVLCRMPTRCTDALSVQINATTFGTVCQGGISPVRVRQVDIMTEIIRHCFAHHFFIWERLSARFTCVIGACRVASTNRWHD